MESVKTFSETNKRLYNPYTESLLSAVKKRRLQQGVENIMPTPGLIGPPTKEAIPWTDPLSDDVDLLASEAQSAEEERQSRINKATYETIYCGQILNNDS